MNFNFLSQYFCYNWRNRFPLSLIIRQYFFNNKFHSIYFIILSDLNSNPNNLLFSWLFNVSKCFINSSKNIRAFFVRIISNKPTTKLLFYCFLSFYFIDNTSVAVPISPISIASLCLCKYKSILQPKTLYCVCIFYPSDKFIILVSTDIFLLKWHHIV